MKCPVCSHVYPDTLSRCSRCGRVAPDQATSQGARSTLIEFPAQRPTRTSLPDWRVELNEKVRAIKARRNMEALTAEAAALRQPLPPRSEAEPEPEPVVDEPSNPIVAAALDRVRRASEQAALATRQGTSQAATARVAVPAAPIPLADHAPRVIPLPQIGERETAVAGEPTFEPARSEPTLFDPAELLDGLEDDLDLLDLDEGRETLLALPPASSQRASIALRIVAGLVDAAVLCLVAFPFVATTYAIDGDVTRPSVAVLLGSTLVLLTAFYLYAMLSIAGRTVGMMFAKLHVVDFDGGEPAARDVLLRVVGYFVAALPIGLGFVWALFNAERCGWHDSLSGTRVVED